MDLRKKDLGIAYLELSALLITLIELFLLASTSVKTWKRLRRKNIIFKCDNANVVMWLLKGRCRFFPWNHLLEFVFLFELVMQCKVIVEWVASDDQKADPYTRGITSVIHGKRKIKARKHSQKSLEIFANLLINGPPLKEFKEYLNRVEATRNYEDDAMV